MPKERRIRKAGPSRLTERVSGPPPVAPRGQITVRSPTPTTTTQISLPPHDAYNMALADRMAALRESTINQMVNLGQALGGTLAGKMLQTCDSGVADLERMM